MTRREWMALAASTLASAADTSRIGVELYTVREPMKKDPESTLRSIAEIGYRSVEGSRAELVQIKPLLDKFKLAVPSVMIETPLVTGNWAVWKAGGLKEVGWDEALGSVKALGAQFAVLPYLMPGVERRMDYKEFADKMNAAGERCRKAGLGFCYHNHAFEFEGQPGERPIDTMLARFDPKLVKFELDVFWVSVAGNDPVEFLSRHSARVALVHLKDKRAGTPVQFTEAVKPQAFAEVGSGELNFRAILRAAEVARVQHYLVEQDQTPGDPLASLRKSFEYLRGLA